VVQKNGQSLMHHHVAIVRHRIMHLAPECSAKITVSQSMKNCVNGLNYLMNSRN